MIRRLCTLGLTLLTAAAVLSVAAHSSSEDAASRPQASAAVDASTPATDGDATIGRSGLRVVRDPVTGEIVAQPTAEDLRRRPALLDLRKSRSDRDLRHFDLPGGAEGVALEGWAHHAMRVRVGEDGRLEVVCTQGDEHGGEG